MVRAGGIEPETPNTQDVDTQVAYDLLVERVLQIRLQISGKDCRDLLRIVESWPAIPAPFKDAIIAFVNTAKRSL